MGARAASVNVSGGWDRCQQAERESSLNRCAMQLVHAAAAAMHRIKLNQSSPLHTLLTALIPIVTIGFALTHSSALSPSPSLI